jgi:hypothetical protein
MSSRSLIPSWIETFEDLQSASTVEELWGVLLVWHGIRSSSVWDEPYLLFIRFHRHDSTNADVTAALLCSDHRWRKAAHHLIDRLTSSDVLDDDQLDRIADCSRATRSRSSSKLQTANTATARPLCDGRSGRHYDVGLRDDAMYRLCDTYWLRSPIGKLHNDRTVPCTRCSSG